MNCEISKELLSGVLKENIVEVYKIESNPNFERNTLLYKLYRCGDICSVNIYELAHKCKEWAVENGFGVISGVDGLGQISAYIEELDDGYRCKDFFSNSEQQACFDACQWILDNKDKQ